MLSTYLAISYLATYLPPTELPIITFLAINYLAT